jgi:hypothetical protein
MNKIIYINYNRFMKKFIFKYIKYHVSYISIENILKKILIE